MFRLSARSRSNLFGVHSDLVLIVGRAITITTIDFAVIEGLRTEERQRELVAAGASWTLNSRHLTGHAVDLGAWVGGTIRWELALYDRIAEAMSTAADWLNVPIIWGGDWKVRDAGHFELPR